MCGMGGAFAYKSDSPQAKEGELLRCQEAMIARGPERSGTWVSPNGTVGFVHRRLSIIDLSDTARALHLPS